MRGQAHTLEGIVGALLLLSSLVFALQVTAVTPLSASTSSQHIENQQQATAEGILATADENGSLAEAALYWDVNNSSFHGLEGDRFYTNDDEVEGFELGRLLNSAFGDRGVAFNVDLVYQTVSGERRDRRMVYRGAPSDNAVTASRVVTLYDDTKIYAANETRASENVSNVSDFYAPDAASGPVYNVVRVEVTVWRM